MPELLAKADQITVASGEIFVASSSYREQLLGATGAQAVDMNLFGLQSACSAWKVPLYSWRVTSDLADDNASEAFRAFVGHYDGAGGRAIAELIRDLPPDTTSPAAYPALKELLDKSHATPQ